MAWAERGNKDREAFSKYVESISPAAGAWDKVPGLRVQIDRQRTDAALAKAEREGNCAPGEDEPGE